MPFLATQTCGPAGCGNVDRVFISEANAAHVNRLVFRCSRCGAVSSIRNRTFKDIDHEPRRVVHAEVIEATVDPTLAGAAMVSAFK